MKPVDPLKFATKFWPGLTFYKQQREIIYSVRDNDETYVPAGNMLGKDFVAAFIILWFFLTRHPCKIVTTSVKDRHLDVLWGEIDRFIRASAEPMMYGDGGPLVVNNKGMKRLFRGEFHKETYVMKMVADDQSMASFQGHHVTQHFGEPIDDLPRNLFVGDEASGLKDDYYTMATPWAKRMLIFGNTWECNNFFKRAVKGNPLTKDPGGDLKAPGNGRYYRKIIKIKAEDSPNVRLALAEIKNGKEPSGKILVPGVLPYHEYIKRRATWDEIQQCVSLDADWYAGASLFLFPPAWLDKAERYAVELKGRARKAKAIGVDPAEGGDSTAMAAVDEFGLIELVSRKTPDTSVVTGELLAFMRKHGVEPEMVFFDAGGGGKQHVDRLRSQGYNVKAIAFGGAATPERKRGLTTLEQHKKHDETKYVYRNRRAEMFGLLSLRLDPAVSRFAISDEHVELRRQLSPIPKDYDEEGRLFLPPKNKRDPNSNKKTLVELIGCSPDEADALVLANFGMEDRSRRVVVGRAF